MAALEPEEKRRRSPLSYTQEIPLLEQLLASKTHPDLSGGVGIRSLRRSTLGGVDERLEELLRIAIENEQTERAAKIISLQESFDQLRRRLEQSMNQALNPDDIDLFSPLDLLKAPSASSSSSSSAAASSSSPSPSSSNEEDDDFEVFTWLSPTAETTADAANSCSVCWEPLLEGASLAACDDEHVFCLSCWRAHFEVLITEADLITPLGCLATGCKAEATQPEIARLVGDELFQRYLRFSVLAVVRRDARTRWCPALRCEQHVTITDESSPSVQCPACSTQFCPRCSRSPHPGAACKREFTEAHKEISKWLSKLGMRKAKRCPRCRELVEKSDGCNHMTCRCGQGWCWICGWGFEDDHGSYQHFSTGDSLCLGLQFSGSDSLREARDRALGGPGSYKAYRILHGIETPRQRRLRIFEHGYGTPHPRVVDLKDTDDEEGLGGLFG